MARAGLRDRPHGEAEESILLPQAQGPDSVRSGMVQALAAMTWLP